jgi:hypothetical protein
MAREHPILLLAEDLHWADATTMEFLGQLVRDAPDVPLCVCMTARPELVSSLAPTGTSTIPLGRLDRGQIEAMLGALVDDKALPAAAIAHIADRADGVPLFIEELLRTMIDAEILVERGDHYDATGPLSTAAIPATLNALLTARLDRIPRVKGTAQLAAALGREFSVELLAATSGCEPAAVAADLDSLMRAGVMLRKRRGKATIGLFKHALMRDAAYESLSPGARQLVHARIAETLEARFPDVVRTRPDLLAHHHSAAAQMRPAVGYAQRAAELGLQRSTYTEAIAHASNAAAWAHALPGGEAIAAELAANGALIQALMATRGWADLKVKAAADRSTSLLDQLELDSPHRVPTLWFLFTYHHVASHRRNAREVTEQLVALAERSGDQGLGAVAATAHGLALFVDGDHGRARRIAGGAIALYDPARHRDHGPVYGSDSLVLAKTCMAQFCWHAGDDDEAFALVASAIQWARDIGHGPSIALGLLYGCFLHQFAGHTGAVAALAGEILAMSAKYGLPAYEAYAATFHAWATGDGSRIELVVSTLTSLGCKLGLSYYTSLVADGHAARGQLDAAIACIDHCLQLCRDNDEHFYEPELYRRLARYEAQRCPGSEAVRAALAQAVQRARRQQIPRVEAEALGELVRGFEHDHDDHARLEQLRTQYPGLRETAILQARKQGATHG